MTPSHSQRYRAEWLALVVMQLFVAAVVGWTLYRDRAGVGIEEGDRLSVQARVVDENLIRQLEGAAKALKGMRAQLQGVDLAAPTSALNAKLTLLTDAMPGISSMLVLDASGKTVASSRPTLIGKTFSHREYFTVPRQRGDPEALYVSPPFLSSLGTYVMVLSRAIVDGEGRFAGVVTATLDPDYFNVVLRSVLYAADMRATLIHHDGHVFLNNPAPPGQADSDLSAPASMFERHLASRLTATLDRGRPLQDVDERMVAMRTIDRGDLHIDKPMVIAVSRRMADIYRPWQARAWQLACVVTLLLLASSAMLHLNQRRRRALGLVKAAVERERRVASERVELALRGADLGLWDLHVPSGRFIVNSRERAMLGLTDDEAFARVVDWTDLVHPDDRGVMDASIVPHLRGDASNYDCEHRMRHAHGHYIWVSNRAMIVERDAAGSPVRIVGTHMDVSERKRNEERLVAVATQLRESEEELRQITDNLPALVSRLDNDERFRFANRTFGDWLQIDASTLLGKSLREVYGDSTYDEVLPRIRQAYAGHRVAYEREMHTPGGRRRIEVTLVPHMDAHGQVKGVFALAGDITARHEAELLRARSEERLSLALDGSNLALFDWDITRGTLYHSAQAAAMRGEPAIECTTPAAEMQSHVHPDDVQAMLAHMKAAVVGDTPLYQAEFRLSNGIEQWRWIRARGRIVERDDAGRALRLAGTYEDINDRKLAERRLRRLAEFDLLTGLPNRAVFGDRLQQAMARTGRGKPMALLFLDIDKFKAINDTLGHEAGDHLLKVFANRMQGAVRQSDTVARLAGDEFTIILEAVRDAQDATRVAAKLVDALREPVVLAGRTLQVTASIGVTLCAPGETDDAALLRRADAALYEAKRRGRDGFYCDEAAEERLALG